MKDFASSVTRTFQIECLVIPLFLLNPTYEICHNVSRQFGGIKIEEANRRPDTTVVEKVKVGPTKHHNK